MIIESGKDWTSSDIERVNEMVETIVREEMPIYDFYTNQIEVITAEQMLDAYSSVGLPIMYKHWSFGKTFAASDEAYKTGKQGLAYEIVINTNPCLVYIMEQNSLLMQTLVIAHAGIGHNHFFKNNYLFKDWTDAENILYYLEYAKEFVQKCEEKYGITAVEEILDAAHALQNVSIDRNKKKDPLSLKQEMQRKINKALEEEASYNDIWRTVPKKHNGTVALESLRQRQERLQMPEENLLYFVETYSPKLRRWQKELIRIVRNIGRYFYPQGQTKVMNEGCATWTHFEILNKMYDRDWISDGAMFEFIKSHSGVVFQPDFDSPYYNGINPYALGLAMMQDIQRVCNDPTDEDREWFKETGIAGCKDHLNVLKDVWADYRDASFIRQWMSPAVMRKFKMFSIQNLSSADHYKVINIHNERGYKTLRSTLADNYELENQLPQINIVDVDLEGDRELKLEFIQHKGRRLHHNDKLLTMKHLANLWGYGVRLKTVTADKTYVSEEQIRPASDPAPVYDDYYCC